jgi:thioredoxin 1
MIEANDTNFDELVVDEIPVLVKFSAIWCGPCKMMIPVLDELATEYKDKIKMVTVDIDSTSIAQKFNIRGIPTILFFKHGEVVNTLVGLNTKSRVQVAIDTALE